MVIELLLSEKAEVKQTKKSVILRSAFVEHKNNNNKKSTVITESFLECSLGVFGSSDRYQWWREIQSVTLNTGRTEILTDDHILWILWLNSSNICTAEMFMQVITFPDGNEIFWDRLKMNVIHVTLSWRKGKRLFSSTSISYLTNISLSASYIALWVTQRHMVLLRFGFPEIEPCLLDLSFSNSWLF